MEDDGCGDIGIADAIGTELSMLADGPALDDVEGVGATGKINGLGGLERTIPGAGVESEVVAVFSPGCVMTRMSGGSIMNPSTTQIAIKHPLVCFLTRGAGSATGAGGNAGKPSGVPARGSKMVRAQPPAIEELQSQQAMRPVSDRYHRRVSLEFCNCVQPGPYDLLSMIAVISPPPITSLGALMFFTQHSRTERPFSNSTPTSNIPIL